MQVVPAIVFAPRLWSLIIPSTEQYTDTASQCVFATTKPVPKTSRPILRSLNAMYEERSLSFLCENVFLNVLIFNHRPDDKLCYSAGPLGKGMVALKCKY